MGGRAILCVDDEAIQNLSLKRELERTFGDRFIVETANNAENALGVLKDLVADGIEPFLLITDWLMPGMRGDELISKARAIHPGMFTIMITGQADEDTKRFCNMGTGVLGILDKPWRRSELVALIERTSRKD